MRSGQAGRHEDSFEGVRSGRHAGMKTALKAPRQASSLAGRLVWQPHRQAVKQAHGHKALVKKAGTHYAGKQTGNFSAGGT